jgi:hypothetical protein
LLRHVARLVEWLVVDYFASVARPGASARRAARRRLLHLRRTSGCFGYTARHVAPLVVDYFASRRLVVDYFASVARPGASARRAARHRLLRLCCASGCLGTSRGSPSTTSTTSCVQLLQHVARLVE